MFIVVEAASACKLLSQMCKLLSFLAARASVLERKREREGERVKQREGGREGSSTAAEHRIDEFVGRVSATLQHHLPARCLTLGIDPNFAAIVYSFKIPSNIRSEICRPPPRQKLSGLSQSRVLRASLSYIVTSITLSTLIRASHLREGIYIYRWMRNICANFPQLCRVRMPFYSCATRMFTAVGEFFKVEHQKNFAQAVREIKNNFFIERF